MLLSYLFVSLGPLMALVLYRLNIDYNLQAGIDTNDLTIALEPEAAALFVKHIQLKEKGGDLFQTFAPGSKYIVVDAGGMYQSLQGCDNGRDGGGI